MKFAFVIQSYPDGRGRYMTKTFLPLIAVLWLAFSGALQAQDYKAVIASPTRNAADLQSDSKREPLNLLEFIAPREGWHVLDMAAGAGYSTELLATSVGPKGKVFAQHAKLNDKFNERAKTRSMSNVENVVQAFDASNPQVHDLDLVTFLYGYHDTTYVDVDRAHMNKALFDALKPGGLLVVADHSAKPEDGATVGKTFHRIAQDTVRREIEATGFVFVGEGDFLRHPEDLRTNAIFSNPTPVDNFIMKFRKP
jgi:predicted methyltransferase